MAVPDESIESPDLEFFSRDTFPASLPRVAQLQRSHYKTPKPPPKQPPSPQSMKRLVAINRDTLQRLYHRDKRHRERVENELHKRYDFVRQPPTARPLPRAYRKRKEKKQEENPLSLAAQDTSTADDTEETVTVRGVMKFVKWDPKYFKISDGGRTVTSISKWTFTPALCDTELGSGKHTWSMSIGSVTPDVLIGITNRKPRGYHGIERKSWAYHGITGRIRHEAFSQKYGPPLKQNDVLTVELELTDEYNGGGTLQFAVNGEKLGIAFQDLNRHVPLVGMVDVWNKGTVTMLSHTAEDTKKANE